MATHFWLFPWFALLAGLAAVALGWVGAGRSVSPSLWLPPRSVLVLWVFLVIGAILAGLKLGATAGFDFLAARGLLLGALGGLLLVILGRRVASETLPPMLLGLGTALVAAGRLWLTHAEVSGLTALALGVALSVLCLGVAPTLLRTNTAGEASAVTVVLGLLYVVSLAATVALGFIRAHTLGEMFWADIPLVLGAALSLGMAVGMGSARRAPPFFTQVWPPIIATVLVLILLSFVTHVWRLAGLLALGAVLFAMLARLSVRSSSGPEALDGVDDGLGPLVGGVMIVAGATLAFALSSGYGLGLFALGGWLVSRAFFGSRSGDTLLPSALGFTSLLLVYRLGVLQNNPAVRASGPGDTWDLFAISLGALLPLLAAEWVRQDGQTARLAAWAVTLQWVLSLAIPAVFLDYIWQPRSVAGLLLGAALGQLLAGLAGDAPRRFAPLALSGVVLTLTLFQFLPVLGHVDTPTRTVRLILVSVGAALLLIRLFLSGRAVSRPVEVARG